MISNGKETLGKLRVSGSAHTRSFVVRKNSTKRTRNQLAFPRDSSLPPHLKPWRQNLRASSFTAADKKHRVSEMLIIARKGSLFLRSAKSSRSLPREGGRMVVPLGLGKFYGSSLPRPRFYSDVKLNEERVDPPLPVMEPFLSWAREAHWSMGGLNFKRVRLQGKIEGNISKLRKISDKADRDSKRRASRLASLRDEHDDEEEAVEDADLGAGRPQTTSKKTGVDDLGKSASPQEVTISPRRSSKRGKRKLRDETP
ncbi:hypothetical protein H6P81_001424 [Aristolochia fimbriata]|uniref:Uncharacterized protein n=1 Tax=Aristolochia fimbriata TaxID=158543 RepID=A0AAV7FAQ6_ARIFI|nr:hypothetical protein H6P81_001424 [Aristolochia fimbriata]